jgi:hypothetical protein
MAETVALTVELVMDALAELGWKYKQESEEEVTITFSEKGHPKIHISLKVLGPRIVATSAIDVPVPRSKWAEVLVDVNEYNARNYRPKVFLSLTPDSEAGMLMGEEVHDAASGTSLEHVGAWVGGHASAFAKCVTQVLKVDLS